MCENCKYLKYDYSDFGWCDNSNCAHYGMMVIDDHYTIDECENFDALLSDLN